uniref:Anaphase-promoting complex subunit 7 n=1 Tax=Ditylenchus dipsaci TaxID=166011 RepID=A0A915DXQ0_9BILA
MKIDLFETTKRLYELELYDDLLLFVELNLQEHKIADQLLEDEQAFVYMCIAGAYFSCSHYAQSARYYDKVLKILAVIRRQNAENQFEEVLNVGEMRFRMHNALVHDNKLEEAVRCLEAVPRSETRPKILFALAKLNLLTRKLTRPGMPLSSKIISNFRAVANEVPEALLQESRAWFSAKQAECHHKFMEGAQILTKLSSNNLRIVLELAHFYNIIGDRQKALNCFQRAHSIDPSSTHGMDVYASLLAQLQMKKELEALATKLMSLNPMCSEVFVAYGYLAKLQHRITEALQFAHRAVTLSSQGRQRSETLLLKAHVLLDAKRLKEADSHLQQALLNDSTNINVYETFVRSLVLQKRLQDAQRMTKNALNALGEDNPRIQFLMALVLSEDSNSHLDAISLLDEVTNKAPYVLDAVFLLVKLYDKNQNYEKAISLLKKHSELNSNAQIHRLLGDFLSKTNQPELACSEYRQALSANVPDPKALDGMTSLNSIPGLATPECPANAVFNSRIPPVAPARARRTAQLHANVRRTTTSAAASAASRSTNEADEDELEEEDDDEANSTASNPSRIIPTSFLSELSSRLLSTTSRTRIIEQELEEEKR